MIKVFWGGGVWYELGTIVLFMICDIVGSLSFFSGNSVGIRSGKRLHTKVCALKFVGVFCLFK
jgi:hypothetical protein